MCCQNNGPEDANREIARLHTRIQALEDELAAQKARTRELDAVVGSVPDGLAIFGHDRRLSFMNDAGRRTFGLFAVGEDPDSGKLRLLFYDADGQLVPMAMGPLNRIFERGETFCEEIYTTRPDRRDVTWIELSGAPVRNPDGSVTGAVILSRDVTERHQAERVIAFQAHLLDSVQDVIIATDGVYRITYWNRAAEALLGWTAAEALGQTSWKLMNPTASVEPAIVEAGDRLMNDNAFMGEVTCHHKNGTAIVVDIHVRLIRDGQGNVCETITSLRDVRERRRAEAALRESERKYRELVQNAPAGIYEINIPINRFLSVNDSMTEMTGYSREELLSMDPTSLLDDEGRERYKARLNHLMRGDISQPTVDYTWVTKDGRRLHVALRLSFVMDENGQPRSMTVIAYDVTERKRMELALMRQASELMAADRNKNLFLNMLSHELRNPLAAIIASLDLLTHFKPDEEKTIRAVHVLRRQAGHLSHLVDDLLDVTRITTGKLRLQKELVEIVGLVKRSIADLQPQYANKKVNLSAELPNRPIVIEADPIRLTQAISNLMHNALKFTPAGGSVCIAASIVDGSAGSASAGPEVMITVRDSGAGIDPEILPHIFEPFSQAEQPLARTYGGLGLGLAIVKGMVELHGGHVAAESAGRDKGAAFTIYLPAE